MITENQADTTRAETAGLSAAEMESATSGTDTDGGDGTVLICLVCPHPQEAHDRIGLRYCAATVAGSFSRGCVCVVNTTRKGRN